MKKALILIFTIIITAASQLLAGPDDDASNNLKEVIGNRCDGRIYIELYRYRDQHGGNLTGEDLDVEYCDSDGNWHQFFGMDWYMQDGNNKYNYYDYFDGIDDHRTKKIGVDGARDYINTFYFDPGEVDNNLYNTQVQFRIAEEEHEGDADDYYYFSAFSWKPDPPMNVRASQEEYCSKIEITWDNPINLNGHSGHFRVYENGVIIATTASNSYTKTGLTPETERTYSIKFEGSCGHRSEYSSETVGRTKSYGDPPTAVMASDDQCENEVKIQWQWMAEDPAQFRVYRSPDSDFSPLWSFPVGGDQRSFVDNLPNANTTYYYKVRGTDECGYHQISSVVEGIARKVPTPPLLTELVQNNDNFVLKWSQSSPDISGFVIERITDEGTATFNVEASETSYTDNNIAGCKTYTYKVRAKNNCSTDGIVSSNSLTGKITPNIGNTFDNSHQVVCSKGYYNDKIIVSWDYQYSNIIEKFDIYRKEYGSSDAPDKIATIDPTSSYTDESAQAGIYYQYTVQAHYTCENTEVYSDKNTYSKDIGFRVPLATVSGNVTFENGTGVKDVSVIAETEDDFEANSLYFDGSGDYLRIKDNDFEKYDFDTAFTFQMWTKPTASTGGTIFQKGSQYKIQYSGGNIAFTAGSQTLNLTFPEKQDTFFCINAVRTSDSLKLYVIYDQKNVYKNSVAFTGSTSANTNDILLGYGSNYFSGYMEDLRLWHRPLSEDEILNTSFRYIAGSESGISAYFRFNELFESNVYDISRSTAKFHENHAIVYGDVSLSAEVPFSAQLAVKGITDENGNYLITGIPYTMGSTYKFTPMYQTHEFDPTQRQLYIGPGSNVHSGIDFVDIAAFRIQGNVRYKDTYFPVKGVSIYIDGDLVVKSNGVPVTTDDYGNYDIYVPIGWHNIQMKKMGHVFRDNGRFPTEGNYNFQNAFSGLDFVDTTLIKVVGKVAGGPEQEAKPNGLGQTENNIGFAEISMTTQREYDLATGAVDSIWQNIMYQDDVSVSKGQTHYVIDENNPKDITIYPDHQTGEFFAYLLPEKYVITGVEAGSYVFDPSFHTTVDLTNTFRYYTETDSILVDSVLSQTGEVIYVYQVDSVRYNHNLDLIYREIPSISVNNKDGEPCFWEKEIEAKNGDMVSITNPDGSPKTAYPILLQRGKYDVKISVYERYINVDDGNKKDSVPVNDGNIEIQNALAVNNDKITLPLNYKGEVLYSFTGGLPNITTGGIGDYLKTMAIVARTGKNNAINTPWLPGGEVFRAYLLGGMPTGNNFVTTGPKKISMILRDPPGSNSHSYIEKGNSYTTTSTTTYTTESSLNQSVTVDIGIENITFVGLGGGIITVSEVINNNEVGVEIAETYIDEHTKTNTVTNTQRWETSTDEDYVGHGGDLFVGYATNIIYGISTQIELMPVDMPEGSDFTGNPFDENGTTYDIGITKGLRISPEIATVFQYSLNHIELFLIPNLKMLRNNYLINQSDIYQCVICDTESEDFGKPNTTGSMTEDGWINGDSYNFTIPDDWPSDSLFVDSVNFYNKQIDNWEQLLEFNEQEKANAITDRNVSFDAGVIYENSVTTEEVDETSFEYEFSISPRVSVELGASVFGVGVSYKMEETIKTVETEQSGEEKTNSVTYGYVLEDSNAGDYFSVDVKKAPSPNGPIFSVRGGQSMCPYEGRQLSKYYQPGTILSEATMQREIPLITCENPIQTDVPEDRPALFNIQVSNISESGDGQWMIISLDEASNQDGAVVKLDGTGIGNGRMILIPPGETLNKTISIQKLKPDVYDYENIGIVLHSACQYDRTDLQEEIDDVVYLSAYFKPVCTSVELNNIGSQWVVNTNGDTTLNCTLENYDLSHTTFEKILFRYKSISTSDWITDMVFYVDEEDYNSASEPKTFINGQSSLNYSFSLEALQDRNYDLKATSLCADGTENNSLIYNGIKDVKRPRIFGSPQPADGILSPNDEIMISFDEDIYEGGLTPYNFSVRGVINTSNELRHNACIYFDGIDDYLSTMSGVNLNNKSFTIEFWLRRAATGEGVVFSQGDVEIGFDDIDRFYVKLGDEKTTSSLSFTDLISWFHFAVSYSADDEELNVFMNDQILLEDVPINAGFGGNERMFIGKDIADETFFNGFMHDLRIWEQARGFATIYADMLKVMTGNEVGIAGSWSMSEAYGNKTQDKARAHHAMLVGAEWRVFPSGYARTFNGVSDFLDINTGASVVISKQMDFTLEFYFKAESQTNTVLFSNGHDNITNQSPPYENVWVVGIDNEGKIYAKNNGAVITVPGDYLDNKWHHFTLVLNRIANTSIYIDGALQSFAHSSAFGGLTGADMTFGARRLYITASQTDYDRYFKGKIDEVRIWELAKTARQITLDMNCKLQGDEMGLKAYYPFDKYDNLGQNLIPTLEDATGLAPDAVANGGGETNTDVPNIKDARPVQDLAFDWVVNDDKIIINVNEQPSAIEKCILEFTVDRVEDLRENRMASPVTWTAYIKKNEVIWEETKLDLEKQVYSEMSFDVNILNLGGSDQTYTISNLPPWLTASETTGSLPPDSYKTIHFSVDPAINIGDYELSVFLTSDFGYAEKLDINLHVFAEEPDWVINPEDFQYSMSLIGQLSINGAISNDHYDMVGAFVDGECRGAAHLQYIEEYDMYEVFLDIYSNVQHGETVELMVWDASEGSVLTNVTPAFSFASNTNVNGGMPRAPVLIYASTEKLVTVPLPAGWRWFSFNVESGDLSDINATLASLTPANGDLIKSHTGYHTYDDVAGWQGTLIEGIDISRLYKIHLAHADTLELRGTPVATENRPITIHKNWNWLSYLPQVNMEINTALANFTTVSESDLIKSQSAFAMYDERLGWIGSLQYMKPNEGYMMMANNAGTLTYPESGMYRNIVIPAIEALEMAPPEWQYNQHDYPKNMTLTAYLQTNSQIKQSENDLLGVFVDNQCRGVAKAKKYGNKHLYFLTIQGKTEDEKVQIKYLNAAKNTTFDITEKIEYSTNKAIGDLKKPIPLTLISQTSGMCNELNRSETYCSVYPNPFSDKTVIRFSIPENSYVDISVFDILGKKVASLRSKDIKAGTYDMEWNGTAQNGDEVRNGIYFIRFSANDFKQRFKIVKTN